MASMMVLPASSNPATPGTMNPLLLASSCCGSWQALNYLLDREDAPGRSDAVPIQSFLELLEGTGTAAGLATQQQASVHGVEEAGSDQHSIPAGPPVGVVTIGGDTALHAVAKYGDGDNFMRSAGVIYRKAQHLLVTQNQRGDTPLHVAARAGSSQMVSRFIDLARGEDGDGGERLKVLLRKENGRKETALHEAVRIGNKDMVDLLMLADSELASYPTDGTSPLYLAILLEQVHIVQSLYDNSHGNLSYSGPDGQNALHAAVLRSQVMTEMLLSWKIGLTTQGDQNGSTPLHFATSMLHPRGVHFWIFRPWFNFPWDRDAWNSSVPFTLLLLANRTPMFQSDNMGSFPIHIAASTGAKKAILKFLDKCPNVAGLCDIKGRTFLHVAIEKKRWNIVAYACKTKSLSWILNMQDNNGNTALHLCVKLGDQDIFALLLENQEVRLNVINDKGETPLDLSESKLRAGAGSIYAWNPRYLINVALKYCHAKHGSRRLDHFEGEYIQPEDEEKESQNMTNATQTLALGSVLMATVAFGATFTLPGGYKGDGTPALSGRYVFDAFIVANSLAFCCAGIATISLMYSGKAIVDVPLRSWHFDIAVFFAFGAVTSLATAFVLSLYLVLAPVAHMTATIICVVASILSLCGYVDSLRGHPVGRALHRRMGNPALVIFARLLFLETVTVFWPLVATFIWAEISTRYHHK
ncbi:hypothetical protein ACQJBY_005030 [Aegilops geniculata]